ncbi:Hydrogen cyanide synthase subunit HcnB [Leucobacter sp. BZR 635]
MTGEALARKSVLVIGAGPAGIAAAQTLSEHGVPVDLIDENARPGGAITRRPFDRSAAATATDRAALGPGVEFFPGSICHGFDGGRAVVSREGGLRGFAPEATIVSVGARERIRPIPGYLLRGVLACGGAQTLLKGSGAFPHRTVVVAGSGPLLLATASQLIDAGVRVRAVVEEADLLHAGVPTVLGVARSMPVNIMRDGAKYLSNILRHGTRLLIGHRVTEVHGAGQVEGVTITSKSGRRRKFGVDGVVLGHGFVSANELVHQAGAHSVFDAATRFWTPTRKENFETTVPGLYAVGDCAGVHGQEAAELEGKLAAYDILGNVFGVEIDSAIEQKLRRKHERILRFQQGMSRLFPQAPLTDPDPASVVCRCEGVTRAEVSEAIDHGATDFRTVKLWTRAGMGICQGRTCQPVLRDYLAGEPGTEPPTVQFPVRPLPFVVAEKL